MTPEEHEQELEEALSIPERTYILTRKTEIEYASAVLLNIAKMSEEVKRLNDELAALIASDAGLPFDPVKDVARFYYDESSGAISMQITTS